MNIADIGADCTQGAVLAAPNVDLARTTRRKLPAFGRELLDIRRRGLVPPRGLWLAHLVVALDSWDIGRGFWRLVIPDDSEPGELDFAAAAGLEVLLIYDSQRSSPARLREAVDALLRDCVHELVLFDLADRHGFKIMRSPALGILRGTL